MSEEHAWAERLANDAGIVLHIPTGVIGKVVAFHKDGTKLVNAPVLEIEPGHTFLADKSEHFYAFEPATAHFFKTFNDTVQTLVKNIAHVAVAMKIEQRAAIVIMRTVLMSAVRMLEAAESIRAEGG